MSSYISPLPTGDAKATGAYAVAIAATAGGTNNDGHATDSAGNVAVDFSWGNIPLQPNDVRRASVTNFGGDDGEADRPPRHRRAVADRGLRRGVGRGRDPDRTRRRQDADLEEGQRAGRRDPAADAARGGAPLRGARIVFLSALPAYPSRLCEPARLYVDGDAQGRHRRASRTHHQPRRRACRDGDAGIERVVLAAVSRSSADP